MCKKIIEGKTNIKTVEILNATRWSSILEYLVNNPECGYEHVKFKIVHQCSNVYDLIQMEAIFVYLNKPELYKKKEFDYVVALFN